MFKLTKMFWDSKSQIAYEYAKRQSLECSTFWVKTNSLDNFVAGFISIAELLNIGLTDRQNAREKLDTIKAYLESNLSGSWLIVLDEADEKELFLGQSRLLEYLPQAEHGRILITTRDSRIAGLADGQVAPAPNGVCVGPFPTEGVELFHKYVRHDLVENYSAHEI
jgi:hypothetical protein